LLYYRAFRSERERAEKAEHSVLKLTRSEAHYKALAEAYGVELEILRREKADLLRQGQSMAERIASLRVEHKLTGGNDLFVPTAPPTKPYSEEIDTFLAGLLTEEARLIVEEQIELHRSNGIDDTQIYEKISKGESL
jgi:hypothetical protein